MAQDFWQAYTTLGLNGSGGGEFGVSTTEDLGLPGLTIDPATTNQGEIGPILRAYQEQTGKGLFDPTNRVGTEPKAQVIRSALGAMYDGLGLKPGIRGQDKQPDPPVFRDEVIASLPPQPAALAPDPSAIESFADPALQSLIELIASGRDRDTEEQAIAAARPFYEAQLAAAARRDLQSDAQRQWTLGIDLANQRAHGDPRRALASFAASEVAKAVGMPDYEGTLGKYSAPDMPPILQDRLSGNQTSPITSLLQNSDTILNNPKYANSDERAAALFARNAPPERKGFWGNVGGFLKDVAPVGAMIAGSYIPGGSMWGQLARAGLSAAASKASGFPIMIPGRGAATAASGPVRSVTPFFPKVNF